MLLKILTFSWKFDFARALKEISLGELPFSIGWDIANTWVSEVENWDDYSPQEAAEEEFSAMRD